MSRWLGFSGVVALLYLVGCSHDGFLVQSTSPEYSGPVVAASVSCVSATLQDGLAKAGIPVVAKPNGGNERLVGRTRSGKVFCVHLRPGTSDGTETTLVRIEWGQEPDEHFRKTVAEILQGYATNTKQNRAEAE
jgi:hypothetical protein